jgi:hypothetical protein
MSKPPKSPARAIQTTRDLGPQNVRFGSDRPGFLSVQIGAASDPSAQNYRFDIEMLRIDLNAPQGPLLYARTEDSTTKALLFGPLGLTHLKQIRELGVQVPHFAAH